LATEVAVRRTPRPYLGAAARLLLLIKESARPLEETKQAVHRPLVSLRARERILRHIVDVRPRFTDQRDDH